MNSYCNSDCTETRFISNTRCSFFIQYPGTEKMPCHQDNKLNIELNTVSAESDICYSFFNNIVQVLISWCWSFIIATNKFKWIKIEFIYEYVNLHNFITMVPPSHPPPPLYPNVLFFIIVGDCALMSLLAISAGYNTTIISLWALVLINNNINRFLEMKSIKSTKCQME